MLLNGARLRGLPGISTFLDLYNKNPLLDALTNHPFRIAPFIIYDVLAIERSQVQETKGFLSRLDTYFGAPSGNTRARKAVAALLSANYVCHNNSSTVCLFAWMVTGLPGDHRRRTHSVGNYIDSKRSHDY